VDIRQRSGVCLAKGFLLSRDLASACARALASREIAAAAVISKFLRRSFSSPHQDLLQDLSSILSSRRGLLLARFLGFEVRLNSPALKVFD
jgi:hypothetical protein